MMSSCDDLQTRLDTLTAARDALAMGTQTIRVRDSVGREVQTAPADGKRLDALIADVRATMSRQGCPGCSGRRRMLNVTPSDGWDFPPFLN